MKMSRLSFKLDVASIIAQVRPLTSLTKLLISGMEISSDVVEKPPVGDSFQEL